MWKKSIIQWYSANAIRWLHARCLFGLLSVFCVLALARSINIIYCWQNYSWARIISVCRIVVWVYFMVCWENKESHENVEIKFLRRKKNVVNRGCLFLAHGTTVNCSLLSRSNVDSSREGISFDFLSVYAAGLDYFDFLVGWFWAG